MAGSQINITLGTAGHIDHGKTALIKCLTGCETDLLKAEKERGMSIELGFAPCTISDSQIGIVDVPGHENFIKTMVAGATGIDAVIFVIAADDGVMPQTREHLDILTLLGVKDGIVALTKADCVDAEHIEIVTAQIREFLKGTFLADTAIVAMSSITGAGFDGFLEALNELIGRIEPKGTDGVFRLPVERTFTVKGYGTVVTGIPVSGSAKVGDEVVVFGQGQKGRIKAIQVYKAQGDTVKCGQCAAVNVPQWDHKAVGRGDVVTLAGYFRLRRWYLCKLKMLALKNLRLKTGGYVKFHTGTSEVVARMYLMKDNFIAAGQDCLVQFRLDEPIVAGPGDRFILRTLSPARTVGGGVIVEAVEKRLRRNKPGVVEDVRQRAQAVASETGFVEYCVNNAQNSAANEAELALRAKLRPNRLKPILDELTADKKIFKIAANLYVHQDSFEKVGGQLMEIIRDFHHTSPESPGISIDKFYELSKLHKNVFDGLVKLLIAKGKIVERKRCLALPDHCETFTQAQQKLLTAIETLFSTRLFNPPKLEEIMQDTAAEPREVQKTLKILLEQQRLVQVEKNLFFHRKAIDKAREILTAFIEKEGELESVKFKYLLDTTRKFAIPLLDYFDRIAVTRRAGNTRYKPHCPGRHTR